MTAATDEDLRQLRDALRGTLGVAEDHAEIRNLLARYCLYLDLDDAQGWAELFTPDAVYEVYGRVPRGLGVALRSKWTDTERRRRRL